ncbi:zinc finger domain-containing protein [Streptomyces mexicanus]|uniref:zinc finger domain-containing protein n=1 Tax=Streptomyces mexicanus TaxID=178566 RepID=UPI00366167AA
MDRREIAALLAFIDRLDPGRAPQDRATAAERVDQWATLLAHVPATAQHPEGRHWDASQVAARHIATSPYPIKPSDIGAPWEAYRSDIVGRHWDPAPPVDPDDWKAYRNALRNTRHAVAVGQLPPAPQHAIEGRPSPIRAERDAEAARRLAALGTYVPKTVRDQLAEYRPHRAQRERLAAAGLPDPLDVPCQYEHCRAPVGKPCTRPTRKGGRRPLAAPHPCRVEAATIHHAARQEQTA